MRKQNQDRTLETPAPGKKKKITQYFDAIGQRYDLADTLMSFGLHFSWRKNSLRQLDIKAGYRILDLCGGAGEFARRIAGTGTKGLPVVCDLSRTMLATGKNKSTGPARQNRIQWVQSDAEQLGFADNAFDAVIVGYGIRNLENLHHGLQEMHRVLIPGGTLVIMEFSIPQNRWLRTLYHWYSFKIMPTFGKVITGEKAPFIYLAESIRCFPAPERVQRILESAGFIRVTFQRLSNGLVTVYSATKQNNIFTSKLPA
ncbi:ubiquinone/menaquinone biosynthesis methyltransferase [Desulfotignum balticum]|jgi:demethylmenaquinone methyltransferase/2-methoxy-6-polyprenyl-1,4-benzoquinol methylase|uniref:Demethylmenaquinone methyltransferase n=1 Tax=Desulfotignum balticum TaxID=115781 RepID=B2DD90_9BACT|nr:ubiquinone/menaquinone biosynthesis methyltransferase [Desulfotignum balticum]BAG28279.1 methyltransferase [Desulfotignum balticum]